MAPLFVEQGSVGVVVVGQSGEEDVASPTGAQMRRISQRRRPGAADGVAFRRVGRRRYDDDQQTTPLRCRRPLPVAARGLVGDDVLKRRHVVERRPSLDRVPRVVVGEGRRSGGQVGQRRLRRRWRRLGRRRLGRRRRPARPLAQQISAGQRRLHGQEARQQTATRPSVGHAALLRLATGDAADDDPRRRRRVSGRLTVSTRTVDRVRQHRLTVHRRRLASFPTTACLVSATMT